jgi:hypothetical protein
MRIAMVSAVIVALAGSIDDAAPQHPAYPMPTGTPNLPTAPNLTRPLPLDPARPYFLTVGKLMRVGTGLAGDGIFLTLDVDTTNNTCQIKSGLHMDRTHPQYRETCRLLCLPLPKHGRSKSTTSAIAGRSHRANWSICPQLRSVPDTSRRSLDV